jgi:predicted nuclease of predicted toxin-antitoxin system
MNPLELPLLADENIHAEVVAALRKQGKDVRTVEDEALLGSDDVTILRRAHAGSRVVMTHDADFGTLAVQTGEPYTGILFLRPGHISPAFVLDALAALEASAITVAAPFIAVVERKDGHVRVRVRSGT